ncbi:MAG: nuclear transport factor 2 family protein [Cyanobacteria bacterium P01_F01_bin.53]
MSLTASEALRSTLNEWMALFNAHDIDGLMELYDPEAAYAPHTGARKSTLSAIRESFIADFAISPVVTFEEEALIAEGNLGYATGQFSMRGTNPQDQSEIEDFGRVVVIFRKSDDDQWKLVFDMDNRPPDVRKA